MRTTVIIIAVVCVATVLTEVLGVAFLWYRGQLSTNAMEDIRLVLAGQDPNAFAIDEEKKQDELSSEDYINRRTMRILELNTRQEELDLLKKLVIDNRKELIDDQDTFEDKRLAFQEELQQLQTASTSAATEQTRGILSSLQPADAMSNLMALSIAENVVLLKGMPEKTIARILKEFLNGDENQRQRGQEVFTAISQGKPATDLIAVVQQIAQELLGFVFPEREARQEMHDGRTSRHPLERAKLTQPLQ